MSDINELINKHKHLIIQTVNRLNMAIPVGITRDDLISFGLVGLQKAITTHDKNRGSFQMYAKCKIKNEIIDNVRYFSVIPRSVLEKRKKFQAAILHLENKLSRTPTKEEIKEYMGIDDAKYKKYEESFNCGVDFSLNNVFQNSNDEIEEYFLCGTNDLMDAIEAEEFRKGLVEILDSLSEKERKVVYLKYYYNLTYREIAHVLGISESTVGEIHNKALIYMRAKIIGAEIL